MSKIKLNLTSGISVEKPLINAFSANNTSYVILDNEMNGSMGLPIILVCKMVENKLMKISDPNEWNIVKDYLKQIIAGNKLTNIEMPALLQAEDIYYTQLTLPVPSFDALKKAYEIVEPVVNTTPVNNNEVNVPLMEDLKAQIPMTPEPIQTVSEPVNIVNTMPYIEQPLIAPVLPQEPEIANTPMSVPTFEMPSVPVAPLVEEEVITPSVEPSNYINPISTSNIFESQKEAFLEACGNMFDALVIKFEKELNNKK